MNATTTAGTASHHVHEGRYCKFDTAAGSDDLSIAHMRYECEKDEHGLGKISTV
jgi:hypothetical protein